MKRRFIQLALCLFFMLLGSDAVPTHKRRSAKNLGDKNERISCDTNCAGFFEKSVVNNSWWISNQCIQSLVFDVTFVDMGRTYDWKSQCLACGQQQDTDVAYNNNNYPAMVTWQNC